MSAVGALLDAPVVRLRLGGGRLMETAFTLTSGDGRLLALGREPSLGPLGQVRRLTAKTYRDFRRTVTLSAEDGTVLMTVDKERYAHTRRANVLDGAGRPAGRIDDASPMLSKRFRLRGPDGAELGRIEGERGVLAVTDGRGAEVGEISYDAPGWTLRRTAAHGPPGVLLVAGLVLAELTRGR
ncbi:hypothetical protein [Actinomadura formosensis]|uniref:hypothetical protein n=1 Tax=Actinomadura formosensis TaxID=60706 RepID=UPI000833C929|nr:hypothetical protein [Actinomadura formosensis]